MVVTGGDWELVRYRSKIVCTTVLMWCLVVMQHDGPPGRYLEVLTSLVRCLGDLAFRSPEVPCPT